MRTIPIVSLPGSFPVAAARSGGRIVRAVGDAYTAAPGNWAPASRPVRAPGGVYTGWRYKIATNRCLNARRAASRRPARNWDMTRFEPLVPTPRDEPVWLQPFPDALLEG